VGFGAASAESLFVLFPGSDSVPFGADAFLSAAPACLLYPKSRSGSISFVCVRMSNGLRSGHVSQSAFLPLNNFQIK
jgi:hypothetical protein